MRHCTLYLYVSIFFFFQAACAATDNEGAQVHLREKVFSHSTEEVAVSGTLTGVGVQYKNNLYGIRCVKGYNACFISFTEQIGPFLMDRMIFDEFPIKKWTENEVVAAEDVFESANPPCFKRTITLQLNKETVFWVQEPINQTHPNCVDSDTRIYKWTIEDSPFWKTLHAKQK